MQNSVKASLFHACPHTTNMGVSALFASAASGLHRRVPGLDMAVFDTKLGVRRLDFRVDDGEPISMRVLGYRTGRRFYRSECLTSMRMAARMGAMGRRLNSGIRTISDSDVVLDVSGGDSFTDMYPDKRIEFVSGCKEVVLKLGKPLILLPQTYGPFDESLSRASSIVRGASACYARDERSFANLKSMLGDEFDPDRHKCGVDMAFGLSKREPGAGVSSTIRAWLDDPACTTIGFNLSGLIGNVPGIDKSKYGFRSDYRSTVVQVVTKLLAETETRIVFVPHVMGRVGVPESDLEISRWVFDQLSRESQDRVKISSIDLDQCEVKWLISRFDWFCGTRMHATIAGLSSGVPTTTISYSDKALGVFETCGQGGQVFDPRSLASEEIVDGLFDAFQHRSDLKRSLVEPVLRVKARAEAQMDDIASMVEEFRPR